MSINNGFGFEGDAPVSKEARNADIGLAVIFITIGFGGMAMVLFDQSGLNVPLWVAMVALSTFVTAGTSFLGRGLGIKKISQLSSMAVVYCLSIPGLWIMLDSGDKSCTAGNGFSVFTVGDIGCRVVFGFGGLITLGFAILMTVIALRKPKSSPDPQN